MKNYSESDDNLLPEYDLSKLKGGVRGKYAERCKAGIKVVPPQCSQDVRVPTNLETNRNDRGIGRCPV